VLRGVPSGGAASAMGNAPFAHGLKDGRKAAAVGADGVFDFGRDLRVDLSFDQTVAFELAKLRGHHFLRRSGNQPPQFTEAADTPANVPKNDAFPFSANDVQGPLDGTGLFSISHGTTSL
jgi:hypothetical protein